MTERQKRKYATANDFHRITADQLWYHARNNMLGLQSFDSAGTFHKLHIGEMAVTNAGIYEQTMAVHDFKLLGWTLIGDF